MKEHAGGGQQPTRVELTLSSEVHPAAVEGCLQGSQGSCGVGDTLRGSERVYGASVRNGC